MATWRPWSSSPSLPGRIPASPATGTIEAVIADPQGLITEGSGAGTATPLTTTPQQRLYLYTPEMNLLAETELTTGSTPSILYEYVWMNGHPVAQIDGGTAIHWTFTDHLGTPTIQTDSSGAPYWRAEYEPYGAIYQLRTGDQHQPLRLPGQEAEQFNLGSNGLTTKSYNIFRWYQPWWGRYAEADPLNSDRTLKYAYASDAPLRYTDALGLEAEGPVFGPPPVVPIINPILKGPYFPFWPSPYGGGEFYYHGNYGGPGWSGGSWAPGGGEHMPPWAGVSPTDREDTCYAHHDRCYINCRQQYPTCPSTQCGCERRCDRKLAVCLKELHWGIRVAATAAFFNFHGHLPCRNRP